MIQQFQEVKNLITNARNILLASHEDPDGDALGSILACKIGLEKLGKKTTAFCPSSIPPDLNFLPRIKEIKKEADLENTDLIVGLDYGGPERLGLDKQKLTEKDMVTIDHHLPDRQIGLKIIDEKCSSTAELIYQLFSWLDIAIDQEIATCLLTGIFSDTGGFRHANTSAQTLKIAGELLLKGAPLQKIAKAENAANLPDSLKLWITAFKNLEIDLELGIIFSLITCEDFLNANAQRKSSAIAGLLSSVPQIKFALLCAEKKPGTIECSLRSQNDRGVNVAAIARTFGGGGHRLAAGFHSSDRPEDIVNAIKKLAQNNFASLEKEI